MRFVDFDASLDRGAFSDPNTLALLDSIDELHLCESCVREACEILSQRPEVMSRQLREIRRLEKTVEHWRDYAKRIERTVGARPEPLPRRH